MNDTHVRKFALASIVRVLYTFPDLIMQTMDNVERKCASVFRAMYPDLDIEMPDDRLELRLGTKMLHKGG